jgi:hypothetical protein
MVWTRLKMKKERDSETRGRCVRIREEVIRSPWCVEATARKIDGRPDDIWGQNPQYTPTTKMLNPWTQNVWSLISTVCCKLCGMIRVFIDCSSIISFSLFHCEPRVPSLVSFSNLTLWDIVKGLLMKLKEIGWEDLDQIDLALGRDRWRALVIAVMNFRV